MNPYSGCDFFSFFHELFKRLGLLIGGNLSFSSLVSDEVQLFVLILASVSAALVGSFSGIKKNDDAR